MDSTRLKLGARVFAILAALTLGVVVASTPSLADGGGGYGSDQYMKPVSITKLVPVTEWVPVTKVVYAPVRVAVVKRIPVVRQVTTYENTTVSRRFTEMRARTSGYVCHISNNHHLQDCATGIPTPTGGRFSNLTSWAKRVYCSPQHPCLQPVTAVRSMRISRPVTRSPVTYRKVVMYKTVVTRRFLTVLKPVIVTKSVPLGMPPCTCQCACGFGN